MGILQWYQIDPRMKIHEKIGHGTKYQVKEMEFWGYAQLQAASHLRAPEFLRWEVI